MSDDNRDRQNRDTFGGSDPFEEAGFGTDPFGRRRQDRRAGRGSGPGRILDELARLATDAAGVAQGARREVETAFRSQAERVAGQLDLVSREEFEAMRDVALRARAENKALSERVAALEAKLEGSQTNKKGGASGD